MLGPIFCRSNGGFIINMFFCNDAQLLHVLQAYVAGMKYPERSWFGLDIQRLNIAIKKEFLHIKLA